MKNYYYMIWADDIQRFKHFNPDDRYWKLKVFALHTYGGDTMLFASIAIWLKFFDIYDLPIYHISLIGTRIDSFLSFIVSFSTPFIIINYFLIFWKDRYKKIIEKYPLDLKKPSYALIYGMTGIVFAFISFSIYFFVKN